MHDKDAEAVTQFAEDEKREEEEQAGMAAHDPLTRELRERLAEGVAVELGGRQVGTDDDAAPMSSAPFHVESEAAAPSAADDVQLSDPGLAVPVTHPWDYIEFDSPRASASARPSDHSREEMLKRQKTEEAKKQRISRLKAEYDERLSAVKIAYKEYFTMDDYATDLDTEAAAEDEDEDWVGEDAVVLSGIPEDLWSDAPIDQLAPGQPEKWIDDLADRVEIQRLCTMGVLVSKHEFHGEITGSLTTKMVSDWRLKVYGEGENEKKRWMRRPRLVARESATSRRLGTFSPATGTHTANLLQLKYLGMKASASEATSKEEYDVVMACLDVRDAFLQVEQDEPVLVNLLSSSAIFQDNAWEQNKGFCA